MLYTGSEAEKCRKRPPRLCRWGGPGENRNSMILEKVRRGHGRLPVGGYPTARRERGDTKGEGGYSHQCTPLRHTHQVKAHLVVLLVTPEEFCERGTVAGQRVPSTHLEILTCRWTRLRLLPARLGGFENYASQMVAWSDDSATEPQGELTSRKRARTLIYTRRFTALIK